MCTGHVLSSHNSTTRLNLGMRFAPFDSNALMALLELGLVLIYTCGILIKSCDTSAATCRTFGFGDTSKGVYLFFLFFGLGMLVLQLVIGLVNLWITGRVPTVLLIAKAHSMSPTTIMKRVLVRKSRYVRRSVVYWLRLDVLSVGPRDAVDIFRFRATRGRMAPTGVPDSVQRVVVGSVAELRIKGAFPQTKCWVQVDLETRAIRWGHRWFLSLSAVQDVQTIEPRRVMRRKSAMEKYLHMATSLSVEEDISTPSRRSGRKTMALPSISSAINLVGEKVSVRRAHSVNQAANWPLCLPPFHRLRLASMRRCSESGSLGPPPSDTPIRPGSQAMRWAGWSRSKP
jgi:hypothetical protein